MPPDENLGPEEPPEPLGRLGMRQVLESPLSVVKLDVTELKNFTGRLNEFLKDPGIVALRICECCINVT